MAGALGSLARTKKRAAFNTAEVADALGWPLRTVQRAMSGLVEASLVELVRDPSDKRGVAYQMRAGSGADMRAGSGAHFEGEPGPECAPEVASKSAPEVAPISAPLLASKSAPLLTSVRAGSGAHLDGIPSSKEITSPRGEGRNETPPRNETEAGTGTASRSLSADGEAIRKLIVKTLTGMRITPPRETNDLDGGVWIDLARLARTQAGLEDSTVEAVAQRTVAAWVANPRTAGLAWRLKFLVEDFSKYQRPGLSAVPTKDPRHAPKTPEQQALALKTQLAALDAKGAAYLAKHAPPKESEHG